MARAAATCFAFSSCAARESSCAWRSSRTPKSRNSGGLPARGLMAALGTVVWSPRVWRSVTPTTAAAATSAASATMSTTRRFRMPTSGRASVATLSSVAGKRVATFTKAMPNYRELLQQIKAEIEELDVTQARELLAADDRPLVLDVRELDEWTEGRIPGAILIPEVGEEGQLRLLDSRVLLLGAGGLGSPSALYLAAAGVGRLGIVDDDRVDASNLQRQVLHSTARLGEWKAESARRTLEELNPDVEVVPYIERLTSENVERILADGWDVIVDGADNFPTRYLINDAAVWHDIPLVHGSIYRFEGQATVFKPHDGPCYRCLFPQPPPPELAPSCAEGGVLGVLPGVIGSLQASEALKLALGIGESLAGRLLLFDALATEFSEVTLRRDPDCPVCGEHPTITAYIDYVEFCQGRPTHA